MGYTSKVKILLKKVDLEELKSYVANITKKDDYNLLNAVDISEDLEESETVIGWDWIKWYEEFPDVSNIIKGLDYLEKNNRPFTFIRIGEDYEDTEVRDHRYVSETNEELFNYLGVYRDIEVY